MGTKQVWGGCTENEFGFGYGFGYGHHPPHTRLEPVPAYPNVLLNLCFGNFDIQWPTKIKAHWAHTTGPLPNSQTRKFGTCSTRLFIPNPVLNWSANPKIAQTLCHSLLSLTLSLSLHVFAPSRSRAVEPSTVLHYTVAVLCSPIADSPSPFASSRPPPLPSLESSSPPPAISPSPGTTQFETSSCSIFSLLSWTLLTSHFLISILLLFWVLSSLFAVRQSPVGSCLLYTSPSPRD